MKEDALITLTGTVDAVIYENEQTGFAVIELDTKEELLPVVGVLFGVKAGEELTVTGSYATHPRFGHQFKAEIYERRLPADLSAIQKFLESGAVKGIGPVMAKRIIETFGEETLSVLEETPSRLREVKGISEKKALELSENLRALFSMRQVMMFLTSFGLTPHQSVRVYKKWGSMSLDLVKQNPYLLCDDDVGASFSSADSIAFSAGIKPADPRRVFGAICYVLRHNLQNGHTCLGREEVENLSRRLLPELSPDSFSMEIDNRLASEELFSIETRRQFLFLPAYYAAERYIALRLQMLLYGGVFEKPDLDRRIQKIEERLKIRYEKLQKKAIETALGSGIMILTGGPGTGKTTTLNGIISLLEEDGLRLSIAAPTGRAAKRISEVTGRDAKTIHRLLEVDFSNGEHLTFVHNEKNPIDADAVIIDEMSMVDTLLFEALLRGIKPSCKLILVGDSDQLPSVGAGNVLRDLIDSKQIPVVELKEIFRQAAQSLIVLNAHRIVKGEMPDLSKKDNDFFFLRRGRESDVIQTVVELASRRLPQTYSYSPFSQIQVLSPQRKGSMGVNVLNDALQREINPPSKEKKEYRGTFCTFREGDKVLQTRNNYDMEWKKGEEVGFGIFNGDIGIIVTIDAASSAMIVDFEERVCVYPLELTADLELAYAVTVHKSQGSEYDAVILPLFGGYSKLYFRNLLYTAVTRARKLLIIVGSEGKVRAMVENNRKTLRYTGLRYMLRDAKQEASS